MAVIAHFTFFCDIGSFDPPCVRSPLDTLESGVLFHIWWLSKQLLVLHDSPPWKVALCLPYPTMPSPPRHESTGWNNQLWNTLAKLVWNRPSCESYCWVFTISSPTFGRIECQAHTFSRFTEEDQNYVEFGSCGRPLDQKICMHTALSNINARRV